MPSYPIRMYQGVGPYVFNPEQLQIPGDVDLQPEHVGGGVIQRGRLTTSVEVMYPGGLVIFPVGSRANLHHSMGIPDYIILFEEDGEAANFQPGLNAAVGGGKRRHRRRTHRRQKRIHTRRRHLRA